jgi:acyl-CoA synthetase (AMP-forming)/AMP-acid ligase II
MKLTDPLRRAAHLRPDAIATIGPDRRKTFRQFESRVSCLASALIGLGMASGDVVAIAAGHSDRSLEAFYAAAWAGGIAVPCDPRLAFDVLCDLINASEATVLVLDDRQAAMADSLIDHCLYVRAVVFCGDGPCPDLAKRHDALIVAADPMVERAVDGHVVAALAPRRLDDGSWRLAGLSHDALCFASLALAAEGGFADAGVGLQAVTAIEPEHWAFSGCLLLRGSAQAFAAADTGLAGAIPALGVTDLLLPAASLPLLLVAGERALAPRLGQILVLRSTLDLRYSPLPDPAAAVLAGHYPAARLLQAWATPELGGIVCIRPLAAGTAGNDVGRPLAWLDLRVADDDGREAARGSQGRLYGRGPMAPRGDWNQPSADTALRELPWRPCDAAAAITDNGHLLIDVATATR